MSILCMRSAAALLLSAGVAAAGTTSPIFREVGRLDLRSTFSSNNPAGAGTNIIGVAWNGSSVYVNGFNNTGAAALVGIARVDDVLTSPTAPAIFGQISSTPASRGYSGLAISGSTLAAAYDSGANSALSIQAFNLDATNSQRWNLTSPGSSLIRGWGPIAFDPGVGGVDSGVAYLNQGSGRRWLNEEAGAGPGSNVYNGTNGGIINGPVFADTAFRGMDFAPDGDIYLRNNNRVVYGNRTGANTWDTRVVLFTPGTLQNQVGTNIAYLGGVDDGDLIIFNDRSSTAPGQDFFTNILVAGADGSSRTPSFLAPDGVNPFAPFGPGNAAYDFSWDAASGTLAVSDFASNHVYIFQVVPAPSGLALLALGGVAAARRRR